MLNPTKIVYTFEILLPASANVGRFTAYMERRKKMAESATATCQKRGDENDPKLGKHVVIHRTPGIMMQ